jgi:hypothetical protein
MERVVERNGIPVVAFLMRFRDHCITHAGMNLYGDQLDSATKKKKKKVERMRNDWRNALIAVKSFARR